MIQRAWTASLVVVLLLAPVSTASAACAWVLWGTEAVAVEIAADGIRSTQRRNGSRINHGPADSFRV